MKTESAIETVEGTDPTTSDAAPRKLLLGKRVVRHFNVKSSIQTGAGDTYTGSSTRLRCYDTVTGGIG